MIKKGARVLAMEVVDGLSKLRDDASADGLATLADCEAEAFLHGHGGDELDLERRVVTRHDHLRALMQGASASAVCSPEEELRSVEG